MRPSGQLLCSLALDDGSHAGPTFEAVVFEKGEVWLIISFSIYLYLCYSDHLDAN
jgi:hypothetical protein